VGPRRERGARDRLLACCGGCVVPWGYIDRVGFETFNEQPVGSGPLRFVSRAPGRCVLEANAD
jgi:hypothetical protein